MSCTAWPAATTMFWEGSELCGQSIFILRICTSEWQVNLFNNLGVIGLISFKVGQGIRYGKAKPWVGKKRRQRNPEGRSRKRKNDGRGPDTLDELVKPKKRKTKASDGRPPDTKKALVPTTRKNRRITVPKSTMCLRAQKPMTPDAQVAHVSQPTRSPQFGYHSYIWLANSCWLDRSEERRVGKECSS